MHAWILLSIYVYVGNKWAHTGAEPVFFTYESTVNIILSCCLFSYETVSQAIVQSGTLLGRVIGGQEQRKAVESDRIGWKSQLCFVDVWVETLSSAIGRTIMIPMASPQDCCRRQKMLCIVMVEYATGSVYSINDSNDCFQFCDVLDKAAMDIHRYS